MFKWLKRKKRRDGGLPRRDYYNEPQSGFQEKVLEKAEQTEQKLMHEEKPVLQDWRQKQAVQSLKFVRTHHQVLKVYYKFKNGSSMVKEIVTLGYVQGVAIAPNNMLVIAYTPRAPSWLDEVFLSLARVLGRGPQQKLLWTFPQFAPLSAMDTTIIVETSRIMSTIWGDFAMPPELSEEQIAAFYAIYQKSQTLEALVDNVLKKTGSLVNTALDINPFVKSYQLIEKTKNQKKKEERLKMAEGGEIILGRGEKDIWEEFNI